MGISLANEHGLFTEVNPAVCRLLGRPACDLLGHSAREFTHPDDEALNDGIEQGQHDSPDGVLQIEQRFLHPDGAVRWAWLTITAIPGPAGEHWTLAHLQDITDRKASKIALRESEAQLAAIASVARCAQVGTDPRPVVLSAIRSLSAASMVVLVELGDDDCLVVTASAGIEAVGMRTSLREISAVAQVWRTGETLFLPDAADSPLVNPALLELDSTVSALWQPVIVAGAVLAVLVVTWRQRLSKLSDQAIRAVHALAAEAGLSLHALRLHNELQRAAGTDPLTGSLNRRAWDEQLLSLVAAARLSGQPLALALVDIDHFKAFNDTFGHAKGDELLQRFASAASACLRTGDVFARWGGEEFILALPNCGPQQAEYILHRVRASIPTGRTCSIGRTTWIAGEPITTTVARADAALYDAKRTGRDRVAAR